MRYSNTDSLVAYLTLSFIVFVIWAVIWFIYYLSTSFTRVITISNKYSQLKQQGNVHLSSNNSGLMYHDTRETVEEYYIQDTERRLYQVGNCIMCGFYIGSKGKYASLQPGDRVEIKGYGGVFTGVADVYGVRRL